VAYVAGTFRLASGRVVLDDRDLSRSTIEAVIDAGSVDTDEPKRDAHLRSGDFLDVIRYPTIAYRSTRIEQPDVAWDDTPDGPRRPEVHRRRKPCERTRLDDDRSAGLRHHLLWLRGRQARRPSRRRRPWSSDAPCSQRGYDATIHEPADMSASCRSVGIVVRHREPDRDTILGVDEALGGPRLPAAMAR
jgi:hypothetical protein